MDAPTDPSGERFLSYLANGDAAILDSLLSEHLDRAYSQARRLLGNSSEAEDAVQEALLLLVRTGDRYDGTVPFVAWLSRRVHFAALTVIRKRGRRRRHEFKAARERKDSVEPNADNDESIEQTAMVRDLVQELPDRYRTIISLHYYAGLSQRDTGLALGLKENTVAKQLQRARDCMRTLLERRGLTITGLAVAAAWSSAPAYSAPANLLGGISVAGWSAGASAKFSSVSVGLFGAKTVAAVLVATCVAGAVAVPLAMKRTVPVDRTWNFDSANSARDIALLEGTWQWHEQGGRDGSGYMATTSERFLASIELPSDAFSRPLLLRAAVRPIQPTPADGFVVHAAWADFTWVGLLKGYGTPISLSGVGWMTIECYITADSVDVWTNGQRSSLVIGHALGSKLTVAVRGIHQVDDLSISEIQRERMPDVSGPLAEIAKIPAEERHGTLPLPGLKSPTGQPVTVIFTEQR